MISARLTAFIFGALPLLAVATPLDTRAAGKCSTGPLQCCESTQKATDPATSVLLALIGVNAQSVDALVGLDCSPISVVGVATGNSCNAQTVCCKNNNLGGLVSLGCVPVSLSN
ncbi:hydrophobin [Trametes versicolor FP-101664 SS1]|uniref:hydrophobin n=1 Tax=Trametes versicolor (strain FP-101664) TaxID=717944 RepID=UPI0004623C13|nr:hydrophobin [Trametes versicolor FP-101664 SS1]EIW55696.1 hydrophobin [Trametes versicolor FP-101664 SS1]